MVGLPADNELPGVGSTLHPLRLLSRLGADPGVEHGSHVRRRRPTRKSQAKELAPVKIKFPD